MTLEEATEKFIRWGRNYYADRTLVIYVGYLAKFSVFSQNKEIKKVSLFNDVLGYAEAMRRSGVADNTINLTMIALRQLWRFLENATDEKLPFGREAIPVKRGVRAKSHLPILEEDLKRLVGVIKNTPKGVRDHAIILRD